MTVWYPMDAIPVIMAATNFSQDASMQSFFKNQLVIWLYPKQGRRYGWGREAEVPPSQSTFASLVTILVLSVFFISWDYYISHR